MIFSIYTDGSCRNNGAMDAVGAWGYVVLDSKCRHIWHEHYEVVHGTTNQRMELEAVANACEYISTQFSGGDNHTVLIYTDSAYLHNCYKQKWYQNWLNNNWLNSKKQPVANQDLWKRLIPFFKATDFSFIKVDGHNGVTWNEYIDEKVQTASQGAVNGSSN